MSKIVRVTKLHLSTWDVVASARFTRMYAELLATGRLGHPPELAQMPVEGSTRQATANQRGVTIENCQALPESFTITKEGFATWHQVHQALASRLHPADVAQNARLWQESRPLWRDYLDAQQVSSHLFQGWPTPMPQGITQAEADAAARDAHGLYWHAERALVKNMREAIARADGEPADLLELLTTMTTSTSRAQTRFDPMAAALADGAGRPGLEGPSL